MEQKDHSAIQRHNDAHEFQENSTFSSNMKMETDIPTISEGSIHSGEKASERRLGFYGRLLRMNLQKSQRFATGLKMEYRRRIGQHLARRLHPEHCGPPVLVSLNLTRRCNLKCHMCQQYRGDVGDSSDLTWYDARDEMPLSEWIKVLDDVADFKPWISITGGEPTLYPHLRELIVAQRERGLPGDITTNGQTLENFADFLVEQEVSLVFVSIDGPEQTHDRIRGVKGAFEKATKGIRALVEARRKRNSFSPIIVSNCTISGMNASDLDQIVPLTINLGVDLQQFIHPFFHTKETASAQNRIFNPEFAEKHGLDLVAPSLPDGEFFESDILEETVSMIRTGLDTAHKQAREGNLAIKVLPGLNSEMIEPYYLDTEYPFSQNCNSLWQKVRVQPDGTITPCMHVIIGNVIETPLMELWNSEKMGRFRKLISKRLFPACFRCCHRQFVRDRIP
jgi:MoaA/NifB/PqqE/SkfB family radical SAM enzyme